MRRTLVRRTVTAATAGLLLGGLTAVPAVAAPGDPVPGWAPRPEEAHREVAVSDRGRVFVAANSDGGYKPVHYLEVGAFEAWDRTPNIGSPFGSHLATGPNGYAVHVSYNTYRLYDGSTWSDDATFYDGRVDAVDMDANPAGDVSVLLRLAENGGTVLARLQRGGQWTTQEVPGVSSGVPADIVLNEQGKTTVVWAVPSGERSTILRSVVHAGRTDWSSPQTVGIVNDPEPNLTMVSDGEGRETIVGGNSLWRQPISTRPHEYRFRTSIFAKLAAGDSDTRVVWPAETEDAHEIRSVMFHDDVQRPQTTLWSYTKTRCTRTHDLYNVPFGVGMAPGGRSYVAVGLHHDIEPDETCPDVASLLPVGHYDRVLNEEPLGYFANGEEFQVAAGPAGPVAVEFKNWDDHADPLGEEQPDGLYSMSFHQR
ncbi:hypothetical protein [Promicromonospora panici]|uniref:hypothetical protein n=1 Tax=Promicromonospora panici TaxID=2219658 RepID=UPI00101BC0AD|nr:hypothetical protein [Promicromonospora panici]